MTALANVGAALSSLPSVAAQASEAALSQALKAVNLGTSDESSPAAASEQDKDGEGSELEDGEIPEDKKEGLNGDVKTVFDDPSGFNVKHPLFSRWTMYFSSPAVKNLPKTPVTAAPSAGAGGWMDDIRKVVTFDCVEEFWGLYNNIVPPSQLPGKADYYLFKDDIIPAWEDEANKNGGKWSIQLPREKSRSQIDRMWLYTMLAAIGETFETDASGKELSPSTGDDSDLITGVIVSSRPNFYRISIWTRLAPADPTEPSPLLERILTVGKHFKTSVLGYEPSAKIASGATGFMTEVEFVSHKDGEKKVKKGKVTI